MVHADFNAPKTFAKGTGVFDGAYGVFLVTNFWDPSSTRKEDEQGKHLVDVCAECNVKHLVWSSLPNVTKLSHKKYDVPHFTDKALVAEYIEKHKQQFAHVTFVMPAFYYRTSRASSHRKSRTVY